MQVFSYYFGGKFPFIFFLFWYVQCTFDEYTVEYDVKKDIYVYIMRCLKQKHALSVCLYYNSCILCVNVP